MYLEVPGGALSGKSSSPVSENMGLFMEENMGKSNLENLDFNRKT
jgi:hypothetical protein